MKFSKKIRIRYSGILIILGLGLSTGFAKKVEAGWKWSNIDPTNKNSAVRGGLRNIDPTNKDSAVRGGLRDIDPTKRQSIPGVSDIKPPDRDLSKYEQNTSLTWDAFPTPVISKDFDSTEMEQIWEGLAKANELMKNKAVFDCVQNSVDRVDKEKGRYNGNSPGFAVQAFISNWPRLDKSGKRSHYLFIDPIPASELNPGSSVLGRAYSIKESNSLGIKPLLGKNEYDFKVQLNREQLPNLNANQVASVVAHEMLHNWGFSHAEIVDGDFAPIQGNFVYEAGYCLNGEGERSTFLDDDRYLFVD